MQLIMSRQWKQVEINAKPCEQAIPEDVNGDFQNLGLYAPNNHLENDIFTLHRDRGEISIL